MLTGHLLRETLHIKFYFVVHSVDRVMAMYSTIFV